MKKITTYARKCARQRNEEAKRLVISKILADVADIQLRANIHCLTGNDAVNLADRAGRVCFIAAKASEGIQDKASIDVDARILRGMAQALADIVQIEATLENFRAAIQSGMAAAERILAKCGQEAIAAAAVELELLLNGNGLWTRHIDSAFGVPA
jgi:ribonuclease D